MAVLPIEITNWLENPQHLIYQPTGQAAFWRRLRKPLSLLRFFSFAAVVGSSVRFFPTAMWAICVSSFPLMACAAKHVYRSFLPQDPHQPDQDDLTKRSIIQQELCAAGVDVHLFMSGPAATEHDHELDERSPNMTLDKARASECPHEYSLMSIRVRAALAGQVINPTCVTGQYDARTASAVYRFSMGGAENTVKSSMARYDMYPYVNRPARSLLDAATAARYFLARYGHTRSHDWPVSMGESVPM